MPCSEDVGQCAQLRTASVRLAEKIEPGSPRFARRKQGVVQLAFGHSYRGEGSKPDEHDEAHQRHQHGAESSHDPGLRFEIERCLRLAPLRASAPTFYAVARLN